MRQKKKNKKKSKIKNRNNNKYKINLYCIKCLIFAQNGNNKIKCEIYGKINLCSRCIDSGFKKGWNYLWRRTEFFIKGFNLFIKQCYLIAWSVKSSWKIVPWSQQLNIQLKYPYCLEVQVTSCFLVVKLYVL